MAILVFIAAIFLDLGAKTFFASHTWPSEASLFYLQTDINHGLAFSLPFSWVGWTVGLVLFTLLIVMYVGTAFWKEQKLQLAVALLLAGGLSNGVDRFLYGGVRDFFQIRELAMINLADIWVLTALLILLTREIHDRKNAHDHPSRDTRTTG